MFIATIPGVFFLKQNKRTLFIGDSTTALQITATPPPPPTPTPIIPKKVTKPRQSVRYNSQYGTSHPVLLSTS